MPQPVLRTDFGVLERAVIVSLTGIPPPLAGVCLLFSSLWDCPAPVHCGLDPQFRRFFRTPCGRRPVPFCSGNDRCCENLRTASHVHRKRAQPDRRTQLPPPSSAVPCDAMQRPTLVSRWIGVFGYFCRRTKVTPRRAFPSGRAKLRYEIAGHARNDR